MFHGKDIKSRYSNKGANRSTRLHVILPDPVPREQEIDALILLGNKLFNGSKDKRVAKFTLKLQAKKADPDRFLTAFTIGIKTFPDGSEN
jgi:hypothetical protein